MRKVPLVPGSELATLAHQVAERGDVVYIMEDGREIAAMVPPAVIRAWEDAEDTAAAWAAYHEPGDSIPWEIVKAEAGL